MNFTATKDNLLFGVTAVQKAVSSKNTLPVLSCIKLEAKENRLYFSATDLEIGIQCHVPVDIVVEGSAVVPARHFSEIVKKLPNSSLNFNLSGENELTIKYEQSQLNLKSLTVDEFPNLPDVQGDNDITIKASLIKQMIKQTVFAAGIDEGRPLFTGVLCEFEKEKIRMVATDTHRLALRQGEINSVQQEASIIIPGKMLSEVARLIYDDEELLHIKLTKNLAVFTIENIRIMCRLLDGQFPNYRQVIPSQYNSFLRIKTKNMQEAVERVALFTMSNDNSNTLNIKVEENLMIISSQSELGKGYEQINVEFEGEPIIISFNARYLLDVFKIIEAENMSIEFTGPLSPCIVRPDQSENFLYLVLPVRS